MNNGKKYLIIALGVLVVLMIGVFILQSLRYRTAAPNTTAPSPTTDPYRYKNTYRGNGSSSATGLGTGDSSSSEDKAHSELTRIKKQLPLITNDYTVDYSSSLDKVILTRKTDAADGAFDDWLTQNGYSDLIENPYTTIYSNKSMEEVQTPYVTDTPQQQVQKIYNMVGAILQQPIITPSAIPTLTPTPTPTSIPTQSSSSTSSLSDAGFPQGDYVYYSQCHGKYDNYPLTPSCSLCHAGCGPTTVAMILSSLVDKKYTPPVVAEEYRDNGSQMCGTEMYIAKNVISHHGLKTSDYIVASGGGLDAKAVVDDFRGYLKNGWTIMVLAYYKPGGGGGHYFWVTDIDAQGNIKAYDPYYGMDQTPPISENVRYPFPKYTYAFGVKKQ